MTAEELWNKYITKNKEDANQTYLAWSFGNSEEMANSLAQLVVSEEKTATASLFYLYEVENEELPKVGGYNIILDGSENAKCIIKTSKVYVTPFNEVTKEHAFKEGEGDKSLDYWRNGHKKFFKLDLEGLDKNFDENIMVVCEEFNVVYK